MTTSPRYPKAKVIRNYGLFGGIVGGLIVFIYLALPMSIEIGMSLLDSLSIDYVLILIC